MTRVVFYRTPDQPGARYLTDDQWLGLMRAVDERPGPWGWAMPQQPGDPVRVLPPGDTRTVRIDADGTTHRESFTIGPQPQPVITSTLIINTVT